MKKCSVFLSLIVAVVLCAGFAFASEGTSMHVSVPFDFYLEDQLLPAGDYHFEMGSNSSVTASSVAVRSIDGDAIRLLVTVPGIDENDGTNCLRFNEYGNKHFLSSVSINGHKAKLKMFKFEKELKSQIEHENRTTAVAQN